MTSTTNSRTASLRFSLRGLLTLALIVALALGWFSSWQRYDRTISKLTHRVYYAEEELRRAKDQLEDELRGKSADRSRSFWESDLAGTNLTGMTIASDTNAFQGASFSKCQLKNSRLEGGNSSFQKAKFDGANLVES